MFLRAIIKNLLHFTKMSLFACKMKMCLPYFFQNWLDYHRYFVQNGYSSRNANFMIWELAFTENPRRETSRFPNMTQLQMRGLFRNHSPLLLCLNLKLLIMWNEFYRWMRFEWCPYELHRTFCGLGAHRQSCCSQKFLRIQEMISVEIISIKKSFRGYSTWRLKKVND